MYTDIFFILEENGRGPAAGVLPMCSSSVGSAATERTAVSRTSSGRDAAH